MVGFISSKRRWRSLAALGAVVCVTVAACQQGVEGDRCNPDLIQSGGATPQYNEDECHSPFSCQVPPTCVIAVCCPTKPPYTDPNCACFANPGASCACTVPALLDADAGSDDAGTAADAPNDAPPDAPAAG